MPQPSPLTEVLQEEPHISMNPMPLVQDVGLPSVEEVLTPIDVDQNGMDIIQQIQQREEQEGEYTLLHISNFHVNYS